jgi:hypothetical protein
LPEKALILTKQHHLPHAIVVLPPGANGRVRDAGLRRWLSRGRLRYREPTMDMLQTVLLVTGHSVSGEGLAGLRLWGQTNERSAAWMAAADPVHLEARLDHLCLQSIPRELLPLSDIRPLFDHLQAVVGSANCAFARIGQYAYLRSEPGFATAELSARLLHGLPPDEFMPQGASSDRYHALISEIQMALHEHPVNLRRERSGQSAVNSLWIWGGGVAPELRVEPIVPLFADDPLFRGYWLSRTGIAEPWPDDFAACCKLAEHGFVAVVPERRVNGRPEPADRYLRGLQKLHSGKSLARLTLLFRDGLEVSLSAADRFRVWRREAPELQARD